MANNPKSKKLRITFIGHRGMGGHENLYPDCHFWPYTHWPGKTDWIVIAKELFANGFIIEKGQTCLIDRFIPGSAIIEIVPAEQLVGL